MYKITYSNGTIQKCNLLKRATYECTVKLFRNNIADFEIQMSLLSKNNKKYKELTSKVKDLKKEISKFGDFFVEGSPLYNAIYNGGFLILPKQQGGVHKVIIEKL